MDNVFKVYEDGKEVSYEIIKLCKKDGYYYIIYKDQDEYYASRYNIVDNKIELDEIVDDSEWDFIDMELNKINE